LPKIAFKNENEEQTKNPRADFFAPFYYITFKMEMQQETPKKLNKKSPRNTHGFIIYFERAETISALF